MQTYAHIAERLLLENVLPFWERHAVDPVNGGYHLNHDARGRDRGPANKRTIAQVRTLWFFSAIARSRYGDEGHRERAEHGFEFLKRSLVDERNGGVFWEVDAAGRAPVESGKHLYAHLQTLYALAEYRALSGSSEAGGLVRELLDTVHDRFADETNGGFHEAFSRDWTPLADGAPTLIGARAGERTLNTNIHVLETLLALDPEPDARSTLREAVDRVFTDLVREDPVSGIQALRPDWSPLPAGQGELVSYGHDLELAWIGREAVARLGEIPSVGDKPAHLVQNALQHGYDRSAGGFFEAGPVGRPATARNKIWWVQAEALLALLPPHGEGDARGPDGEGGADAAADGAESDREDAFHGTLAWIERRQADWKNGEWHARIRPILGPKGRKAGPWKAGYHTGRALLGLLETEAPDAGRPRESRSPHGEEGSK